MCRRRWQCGIWNGPKNLTVSKLMKRKRRKKTVYCLESNGPRGRIAEEIPDWINRLVRFKSTKRHSSHENNNKIEIELVDPLLTSIIECFMRARNRFSLSLSISHSLALPFALSVCVCATVHRLKHFLLAVPHQHQRRCHISHAVCCMHAIKIAYREHVCICVERAIDHSTSHKMPCKWK